MLTSTVTKRFEVPGEPGQFVEFRRLNWKKLQKASDAHRCASYEHVKLLGKEGMAAVRDVTPEQIAALRKDKKQQYDWLTLLCAAIVSWSYSEAPTAEQIEDQDQAWSEWAVEEVLKLAGVIPDEAAEKNA